MCDICGTLPDVNSVDFGTSNITSSFAVVWRVRCSHQGFQLRNIKAVLLYVACTTIRMLRFKGLTGALPNVVECCLICRTHTCDQLLREPIHSLLQLRLPIEYSKATRCHNLPSKPHHTPLVCSTIFHESIFASSLSWLQCHPCTFSLLSICPNAAKL